MATSSPVLRSPLRNKKNFPPFSLISDENDPDIDNYEYERSVGFVLKRHWCFFGEIINDDASQAQFLRNRVWLKDSEGKSNITVSFYLNPEHSRLSFDFTALKKGHTLCIRYAETHMFFDMSEGFRVDSLEFVKVIKCSLSTLFEISDVNPTERPAVCWACGAGKRPEHKLFSCKQCKCAKYCGRECQKNDWKKHKKICKFIPDYCQLVSLEGQRYRQAVPFTHPC